MSLSRHPRGALTGILAMAIMFSAVLASAAETGPVDRKWGLGWDSGLTARLWLGGVWELAVAAGPNDNLSTSEGFEYDTGRPPEWNDYESQNVREDKRESGFVRFQAGRLVSRRGPLAVVCYSGLQYTWTDSRYSYSEISVLNPENNRDTVRDYDRATWALSLGLRPSFVIMDFLTIETAFGLHYSWGSYEEIDRTVYPETGQVRMDGRVDETSSFSYSGWSGMGSLQFIIWF